MCNHENREAAMVVLGPKTWCDPCLVPLVKALNDGGLRTTSSCCGHGHRPGSISLEDGRWLLIAPDDEWMDWLSSRIYERVGDMPGHEPIVSAEDRADEGVRLSEMILTDRDREVLGTRHALLLALARADGQVWESIIEASEHTAETKYGNQADAMEALFAARLAEVEHMHDDAERRVDALTARLADVERERDLHKRADRDSAWEIAREKARADALVSEVATALTRFYASDDVHSAALLLASRCHAALDRARGLGGAS